MRRGKTLATRLSAAMTVLVALLLLPFILVTSLAERNAVWGETASSVSTEARLLALAISPSQSGAPPARGKRGESQWTADAVRKFQRLTADADKSAGSANADLLLTAGGRILAAAGQGFPSGRAPKLQSVRSLRGGGTLGVARIQNAAWLCAAFPVPGTPLRVYAAALPAAPLRFVGQTLALLGATLLAAAWGVSWWTAARLVRPLRDLERAARQLQEGDWDIRLPHSGGEIGVLAAALARLAATLRQGNEERRRFFSTVAHELRTPATYILGYADALASGMVNDEAERHRHIEFVAQEARRLRRLVDDLLLLAQADAGKLRLDLHLIESGPFLEGIADRFSARAESSGRPFQRAISARLPQILADEGRLAQAVFNLLENALRHAPTGPIELTARAGVNRLRITVLDRGPGFGPPPGADPSADGKPSRASSPGTGGGMGLGLAVAREIVAAHSGELRTRPRPGGGALVEISLPRYPGDAPKNALPQGES